MRLRHGTPVVRASFDDPNQMSCAGLEPVMRLAESCGLPGIVAEKVHLGSSIGSNPAGKISAIVAGMVAGADSIDDLDVVRHGGMASMFAAVYAPSTLGSFLREFTHGHVRQVQSAGREMLLQLAVRTPVLAGADQVTFVDVDSMLRRCYGKKKQGVSFGHAKVGGYDVRLRGYNPLIATLSTLEAAPVVAATRLRAGNAGSARGAASMVAEAIGTAKVCGATGLVIVRMDSAFYAKKIIWACRRNGARFSVTTRIEAKIRAACEGIAADRWIDIKYPEAIWDDDEDRWISDAQIAETVYTAFEGTRHAITARLIVRRVKRLDPNAHNGQAELFSQYRYFAVFTDSPFVLEQAEAQHRGHAVIEQVNADLIDGPLAHLPSGHFWANGVWLACAAIAHNLTRATGVLAGRRHSTARAATIRRHLINIAGRVTRHARTITIHLPQRWPWQHEWRQLFRSTHAPPV